MDGRFPCASSLTQRVRSGAIRYITPSDGTLRASDLLLGIAALGRHPGRSVAESRDPTSPLKLGPGYALRAFRDDSLGFNRR